MRQVTPGFEENQTSMVMSDLVHAFITSRKNPSHPPTMNTAGGLRPQATPIPPLNQTPSHAKPPVKHHYALRPRNRVPRGPLRLHRTARGGLPGCHGNTLLVLKLGIPTPSAGLVYPKELRKRITADLHLGAGRGLFATFSHVGTTTRDRAALFIAYRLNIPELPMPQKHLVHERAGI